MKKRGPYKNTLRRMKDGPNDGFFRENHKNKGLYISWASPIDRGNGQISVAYKIFGEKKQYRSPRYLTAWMDGYDIEYCKKVVDKWKNCNNNSLGIGKLIPEFYLSHRVDFFKWLSNTAKHSTIDGYDRALTKYIFPFFIEKLKLDHPNKWDADSIARWESFMAQQNLSPNTRNRQRTALRRYLRFLKQIGKTKKLTLFLNEPIKRESRETVIPGELPQWDNVVSWIRSLPRGRYRFIMALCAGFGVRISEACAVDKQDFMGVNSLEFIDKKNDYIKKIKDAGLGALFLYVRKAIKDSVNYEIIKALGEPDDLPKTGEYTACCTNSEMANLIVQMINNKEYQEEITKDQISKAIASLPKDKSKFKFHLYRSHDYRRLNITLQSMDLDMENNVEICCRTHGHSSREMFFRYYQWGLMQRREEEKGGEVDLVPFKIKKQS